jgi:ABC-2 type transport system ATP-binding protein
MGLFAIKAELLKKVFITRTGFWTRKTKATLAVDGISFDVRKGELFGLLGPNGAGKTTTVKMLSTLLLPTSGSITILDMDILRQTQEVRKRIGFTFGGTRGLYTRLSGIDNLRYFAELYGLNPAMTNQRIPELIEVVGLTGRGEDRVENYSSGMMQRLHLARALLHDPELIFLDEPTVGIDPVGARELRKTIRELKARGKTILLTTHYMAEAEELCDRIAIINQGHLVALDTPFALKQRISGDALIDILVKEENYSALKEQLEKLDGRSSILVTDASPLKRISIRTPEPGAVMQLLAPFISPGYIQDLEVRNQTLEDVYVTIIQGDKA